VHFAEAPDSPAPPSSGSTQSTGGTHSHGLDCQPHSHRFQERFQASEFRVTAGRKHPVKRCGVKFRLLRQLGHSAKGFGHAAKSEQQLALIAVFEHGVELLRCEFRIVAKARNRRFIVATLERERDKGA
jgi:hypothetical protein